MTIHFTFLNMHFKDNKNNNSHYNAIKFLWNNIVEITIDQHWLKICQGYFKLQASLNVTYCDINVINVSIEKQNLNIIHKYPLEPAKATPSIWATYSPGSPGYSFRRLFYPKGRPVNSETFMVR